MPGEDKARELRLAAAAVALLARLPRWEGCPYLLPNPGTKRPYRSVTRSWEVARSRAGLAYLEIDDLRYCDLGAAVWEEGLFDILWERSGAADTASPPASGSPGVRVEDVAAAD
jgi:hypothetical protein